MNDTDAGGLAFIILICTVAVIIMMYGIARDLNARLDAICEATPTCEVVGR
jgi:hypothetical protein